MKKSITLVLALLLCLSLAAPAMAYTTNAPLPDGGGKYTVDIYLVEYNYNDSWIGMITLPPADVGYAKNQIVAAIAALTVPANADVWADGYRLMEVSGKNASLNVTDNQLSAGGGATLTTSFPYDAATNKGIAPNTFIWDSADNAIRHHITDPSGNMGGEIAAPGSTAIYRMLFFARVTGDDASLSFTLSKNAQFSPASASWAGDGPFQAVANIGAGSASEYLVLNDSYVVARQSNGNYIVFENNGSFNNAALPGNPLFRIEVGAKGKTERLYMYTGAYDGPLYRIHVEPSSRELMFLVMGNVPGKTVGDQIKYGDSGYSSLRYFYDRHFEEGLRFTAFNEGNTLTDKDFRAIANAEDVVETVKIEPWTPYVTIPPNVVTNPPKTGGANALGFVLLAAAAGAALVLRRARAK